MNKKIKENNYKIFVENNDLLPIKYNEFKNRIKNIGHVI